MTVTAFSPGDLLLAKKHLQDSQGTLPLLILSEEFVKHNGYVGREYSCLHEGRMLAYTESLLNYVFDVISR